MSIRKITDEQYSDGTTIDGDRLSRTIEELQDFINDVPGGDIRDRWLQSQIILTYTPLTDEANTHVADGTPKRGPKMPFLPIWNGNTELPFRKLATTNESRLKGTALPFDGRATSNVWEVGKTNQGAWTTSFMLSSPAILYAIDIALIRDGGAGAVWTHGLKYSATPSYGGRPANGFIKDLQVNVTIDNPFRPEAMISNSQLIHRHEFSVEGSVYHPSAVTNAYTDMNPQYATLAGPVTENFTESLFYTNDKINLPLPIDSRIRFSIVMPFVRGSGAHDVPWTTGDEMLWNPTVMLTLLEPIIDG